MPDSIAETQEPTLATLQDKGIEFVVGSPDLEEHLNAELERIVDEKKDSIDQEKLSTVSTYFSSEDARLELSPIQKMCEVYTLLDLEGEDGNTAKKEHASLLLQLAFDQQLENPPQYLSHGFDHTINVLRYTESIIENNPQVLQYMTDKYDISEKKARFMLLNVALFHDVGYPSVGKRSKAVHSLNGAEIVSDKVIQKLHKKLLEVNDENEELITDLTKAILYHNADSSKATFKAKLVFQDGELLLADPSDAETLREYAEHEKLGSLLRVRVIDENTAAAIHHTLRDVRQNGLPVEVVNKEGNGQVRPFVGRPLDKEVAGDGKLGLENREVRLEDDPMSAVIRLADNMDIARSRFNGIQDNEAFKSTYRLYGDDRNSESQLLKRLEMGDDSAIEEVEKATGVDNATKDIEEAMKVWKQYLAEQILEQQFSEMPHDEKQQVIDQIPYLDSYQLRHWGGSDVIVDAKLSDSSLHIVVDAEKYPEYSKIPVEEHAKDVNGNDISIALHVGMYQIWRAKDAFKGIMFEKGDGIRFLVADTQGRAIDIPGITSSYLD